MDRIHYGIDDLNVMLYLTVFDAFPHMMFYVIFGLTTFISYKKVSSFLTESTAAIGNNILSRGKNIHVVLAALIGGNQTAGNCRVILAAFLGGNQTAGYYRVILVAFI